VVEAEGDVGDHCASQDYLLARGPSAEADQDLVLGATVRREHEPGEGAGAGHHVLHVGFQWLADSKT